MQVLAALLACLLSLLGGDGPGSQTRISFAREAGQGLLLSKATLAGGRATFHCLSSGSGNCHYLLYRDACEGSDAGAQSQCRRLELERFRLAVGARRVVPDLPGDFDQCVAAADGGDCV